MRFRNSKVIAPVIVAGLLWCSGACADSIPDQDGVPDVSVLDPFDGMPAGDYSSPDAIALANYWFTIISDPWDNYSLIVELFGVDAAATLLADETPAQLLNPPANLPAATPNLSGSGDSVNGANVPEPVTALLFGAGLLGAGLLALSLHTGRRRAPI